MDGRPSIIERMRRELGTVFVPRADPADELPDLPDDTDDFQDEGFGSERMSPAMRAELYPKPPKEPRQRRPEQDQGGIIEAPPSGDRGDDEGDPWGSQDALDREKALYIAHGSVLEGQYGSQAEIDAAQAQADAAANAALQNQEGEVGTEPPPSHDSSGENDEDDF